MWACGDAYDPLSEGVEIFDFEGCIYGWHEPTPQNPSVAYGDSSPDRGALRYAAHIVCLPY